MTIGDKIKALRVKKDISQQELAKVIGVSDQAISAWENNKKIPRMGSVEKLANYFNVPKSFLIENDIGWDKIAVPAAATAAGLMMGGPIFASLMGVMTAVGTLANTMDSHADKKIKAEHPTPFLMTNTEDEKEVLRMFRSLSPANQNTVMVLVKSLSQTQKNTVNMDGVDSGTQKDTPRYSSALMCKK